jgi:hypothetical protein
MAQILRTPIPLSVLGREPRRSNSPVRVRLAGEVGAPGEPSVDRRVLAPRVDPLGLTTFALLRFSKRNDGALASSSTGQLV